MLAAVQAERPVGQLGQGLPEGRPVAVRALCLTTRLLPLLSRRRPPLAVLLLAARLPLGQLAGGQAPALQVKQQPP